MDPVRHAFTVVHDLGWEQPQMQHENDPQRCQRRRQESQPQLPHGRQGRYDRLEPRRERFVRTIMNVRRQGTLSRNTRDVVFLPMVGKFRTERMQTGQFESSEEGLRGDRECRPIGYIPPLFLTESFNGPRRRRRRRRRHGYVTVHDKITVSNPDNPPSMLYLGCVMCHVSCVVCVVHCSLVFVVVVVVVVVVAVVVPKQ